MLTLNKLSENTKPKNSKKTPVFVIAGVAGFIAILVVSGMIGEKADDRIADAQSSNKELQDQIDVIKMQLNNTSIVLGSHQSGLQQHELLLQQHDVQIRSIANNTDIIGSWAGQFSTNINERVTALEGE